MIICLAFDEKKTIQVQIVLKTYEINADSYCKCSKISKTFLFLFLIKQLVIRDGTKKMPVRIAIREDPDWTYSEAV